MDNFKLEKNGYNKKEVDETLEKVKRDYEDTMADQMSRISELKKQLDEANKKLDGYQKKSGNISDALVVAVETAKQIEESSKNVYELEIQRIRNLYNKWENFLNELIEEYPKLKDRFDTKALLKIFSDGIDDVVRQNSVQPQTNQSVGLRSLISKMNKINDKSIEDEKVALAKKNVIKPAPRNTYYDNLTSIGTVAKQQEEFDREYELFIEEQERLEQEKLAKQEQERKEKLEAQRKLEQEKREQELLLIKQEQERQAQLERERLEKEEQERQRQQELLKQRRQEEQQLKAQLEKERLEQERLEKEKLAKQKQEQEKLEREQLEKERQEKLERERKTRLEQQRIYEEQRKQQELLLAKQEKEKREREEQERQRKQELERIEKEKELTNQKFEKSYFDDAPQLIDEDIFLKMEQPVDEQVSQNNKNVVNNQIQETKEEEPKKSQIRSISNLQMDDGDKFESLVDKFLLGDDDEDSSANEYEKAVLSKKKKDNNFNLKEAVTPDDDLSTIMESFDVFNSELENKKDQKNK